MDIKQFQKEILEVFSQMDKMPNRREHTKQSALIHLMEEIGEIARQVTSEYHRPEKFNKENLGTELADTLMFIVVLAQLYDIDLSKEMQESISRVKKKIAEISNSR
jgi:NTP pyrophosphatase (non-canonical NTP hydrolase)